MHQARGLEKHLPNKLVEDVARRASLTDPPLEETDLFRSSVCFQVQRQGSRKRMLQTGWLKRGPKTRPHFGWNRCAQNRCVLPMHPARFQANTFPTSWPKMLPEELPQPTPLWKKQICLEAGLDQCQRDRLPQKNTNKNISREGGGPS